MNTTTKKGFTLIEMLVVVAIISILSGLTLTGIAGFTSRARDTRRVGDMRSIQNYVEAFYSKCGMYPGNTSAPAGCNFAVNGNWDIFSTNLGTAVGVTVPKDPTPPQLYFYGVESSTYQRYVIGANLENDNVKAFTGDVDYTGADNTFFAGSPSMSWTFSGLPARCDDTVPAGQGTPGNKGYCISN